MRFQLLNRVFTGLNKALYIQMPAWRPLECCNVTSKEAALTTFPPQIRSSGGLCLSVAPSPAFLGQNLHAIVAKVLSMSINLQFLFYLLNSFWKPAPFYKLQLYLPSVIYILSCLPELPSGQHAPSSRPHCPQLFSTLQLVWPLWLPNQIKSPFA